MHLVLADERLSVVQPVPWAYLWDQPVSQCLHGSVSTAIVREPTVAALAIAMQVTLDR